MNFISSFILISLLSSTVRAADLITIPAGQIEAIWLSPMTKKEKRKTSKITIHVKSFQVQSHPVRVLDFKNFLIKHPEWNKDQTSSLFKDEHYLSDLETSSDKSPVTFVTWYSAKAYCKSLGLRLLTLNEWEYIAAASETKKDANREELFLRRILDWYGEPRSEKLKNVGSIYKNKYGVWDLHGLIWEWVDDFNSSFVTGESREDGSFNKDMFCGAGALSSSDKENYAAYMRFAFRSSLKGKSSVWNLGFRCAK